VRNLENIGGRKGGGGLCVKEVGGPRAVKRALTDIVVWKETQKKDLGAKERK